MDSRNWDERYANAPLVWTVEPNRFVVGEVAGLRSGRAIDVAASEGRTAVWLAQHGWEVRAVDFSPVGVERGREMARQRDLPAADSAAVLSRTRDAVCPGGTILVVGHDLANLCGGTGGHEEPRRPADTRAGG